MIHRALIWANNPTSLYTPAYNRQCNSWRVRVIFANVPCMGHLDALQENNPWNKRDAEHVLIYPALWLKEYHGRFYPARPLGRPHMP